MKNREELIQELIIKYKKVIQEELNEFNVIDIISIPDVQRRSMAHAYANVIKDLTKGEGVDKDGR